MPADDKVIPDGKEPEVTAYVVDVPIPPVVVNDCGPYASPALPEDNETGFKVIAGQFTVSEYA